MLNHRASTSRRSLFAWLAVTALAAVLVPSAALAGPKHDKHRDRGDRHRAERHHDRDDHRGRRDRAYRSDRDRRDDRYERRDRHHRYDRHDRYDRHHGVKRHHGHRERFVIPRHIRHHHVDRYRPYYHSRSYYRPHRHHHQVYRFPVYTDYGVRYDYYPYCGGEIYVSGHHGRISFHGRRFHIDLGF